MSASGLIIALSADVADDNGTAARLPLGNGLLGVSDRLSEDAGEHDSLDPGFPEVLADVNQSISDFEGRRSVHIDHRVKATKRHNRPPVPHSATTDAGPEFLNKSLRARPILERNNNCKSGFIPVVFDGMLDRNTPIPTYRISLPIPLAATGARFTAPLGERPTIQSLR